jgi:hypothetical protein
MAADAAKTGDEDEDESKLNVTTVEAGANSLVCNECGKMFRNQAMASFHASKT